MMGKQKLRMEERLLHKFHLVEARHWWWEGRRQLLRQLLSDLPADRQVKLLDVGCGTGETMNFLKALLPSSDVYGIDISKVAIKYTKNRGHKKVFLAKSKKLPFKSNFFDAVLYLDVLEHIENDLEALREAKRVLKKNGLLIVSCPALNILWSDHDSMQGHVKRYRAADFKWLAEKLDMKVDWIGYFNFVLSPIIAMMRWLSRIKPLRFFASYESGANYNIANNGWINKVLKKIFVTEVKLTKYFSYPWGVSVAVKMRKV